MAAFSRAAGREPRPATHAFRFVISRFLHCSPADKSPDWTIASRQKFSWTISSSPLSSLACSAADSRRQQHPMVASSPQFQVQVGACICLSDFISLFYHQYAAGALVGPPFELLLTVCGSATPTPRFAAGAVCAEPDARQALIKQQVTSRAPWSCAAGPNTTSSSKPWSWQHNSRSYPRQRDTPPPNSC